MRALNILMPLLAIFLSCTKPPIPAVQDKDDEPKPEVEQGRIEGMTSDELKEMFKGDVTIEIQLTNTF